MSREIVMYSRSLSCPFVTLAKRVLSDHALAYREIHIDKDPAARQRVLDWTGFLSVPTIIVVDDGGDLPAEVPPPLPRGASPRGVDRGLMITEPSIEDLTRWLHKHGFIDAAAGG